MTAEMKKYVFRKYNPAYPAFFMSEKEKLTGILNPAARIEHVGSTAVPGLGGKGIIDIVVGASNFKTAKNKLEEAGYEFCEEASYPERLFFWRDYTRKGGTRRIHIHLVKFPGRGWKEMVGFRDYLLKHPELIKEYAAIKKEAVKFAGGDGGKYKKFKKGFIEKTIIKF
ncbi:hypothetical protein A2303_00475 [Candidatus Falkowbacteria bacterium RIFOXYB2_FULL_47_14]|uniref:GrpB family protein n=1 Tax=Candidatus Falkowbacteria bacterium RIFOXYA2_FULL_47_19 TaxID=1797994 RepID=A0A1F5SLY2_9BACT|nr:MAG: hypothetical protein A2227_03880 [Candidatus Falkowbacteria bacterium RIFOXYA2_FULL_47_19]OGF34693.1 MAG: hypothetical protein A2468_02425 [Candidatus Falkowbacteria bacterium RIFOXYC2_FULL_46_15]OGF42851.1 MAG: hypothetical protein A2303_00475 [Candidatus Falkowbacteria bacterium RIFOXYB2_FULL_47_14]